MTRDDETIPVPALILGAGGLIPFVSGAAALVAAQVAKSPLLPPPDYFTDAIIAYGATILSFLGGVRWGAAMKADEGTPSPRAPDAVNGLMREFTLSVLPPLIAWGALLVAPSAGLGVLAIALVAVGLLDRFAVCDGRLPRWYGRLRLGLTVVAVSCLMAALTVRIAF